MTEVSYSTLDHALKEKESQLRLLATLSTELQALNPERETLLDATSLKLIMDLTNAAVVESDSTVATSISSN